MSPYTPPEGKLCWKPGTMLYPLPSVLVSCGKDLEHSNLLTVAWTGIICTNPAMLSISVRPERHSFAMIEETMEFTVNLTTTAMARATDLCGVISGRDGDKWKKSGLTPAKGIANACPYVKESPVSLECIVKSSMALGSHTMFIGEIVNVIADESLLNPETGKFELSEASPLVYCHGAYYSLGDYLGHFGFSVKKSKKA